MSHDDEFEIASQEELAEAAYHEMYEANSQAGASGHYNNAKYHFAQAIGIAARAGLHDIERRLQDRLRHITEVFRGQF
jgi:hypothetical protein